MKFFKLFLTGCLIILFSRAAFAQEPEIRVEILKDVDSFVISVRGVYVIIDLTDQSLLIKKRRLKRSRVSVFSAGITIGNEYFEKNSLTFTPDMELATTDMILPAVRHNLGLGFIPAEFADSELKSGQVFEIKVKEKLPERNIILIYDKEYPQSIAAKEFQKFLKEKEM